MGLSRAVTLAHIGIALAQAAPARAGDGGFDASPDGKSVAFSADEGDLYALELATLRVRRLTRTEEDEGSPAYSPDGKSIAYSGSIPGQAGSRIAIRPIDGGDARTLVGAEGACDIWPAFSPDGRAVAFVRAARLRPASMGGERWTDFDIRSVGVDGTGERTLTRKAYWDAEIRPLARRARRRGPATPRRPRSLRRPHELEARPLSRIQDRDGQAVRREDHHAEGDDRIRD